MKMIFDFSRDIYSEEVYNFIEWFDLWSDVNERQCSMLEYVVLYCPAEFSEFLLDRSYIPDFS